MSTTKTASSKPARSMAELMSAHGSKMTTYKKGDIVSGTVKKLTPAEILLDIGGKSDALVLEYDKKNLSNLLSLLKVGDTVKASIISSESEEGFPVVSLRRILDEKLYEDIEKQIASDHVITVHVAEVTRGGYFVETPFGIKGFLPNSQVKAEGSLVGKDIEVKVIEFDKAKKRVIFSEKAKYYLTDLTKLTSAVKPGGMVKGEIVAVTNHGVYLSIPVDSEVAEGFIHISEVSSQHISDLKSMFKKGDTLSAQVIEVDKENRRVNLSLKKLEKDAFLKIKEKYVVDQQVKGVVADVKTKGVTVEIEKDIKGMIPAAKIPSDTTYAKGDEVTVQVSGYDEKGNMLLLSPVLKTKFVGYR